MITVLIHYEEWIDPPHKLFDGEFVKRSRVVEVLKLTDLNDMFNNISKIEVLIKDK